MRRPRWLGSPGFSLIEIMVAMTLFAVVLTGFVALEFQYLRAARLTDNRAALVAAMTEQEGHLLSITLDSLDSRVGCTSQTQPLAHQRCIAVALLG